MNKDVKAIYIRIMSRQKNYYTSSSYEFLMKIKTLSYIIEPMGRK